MSRLTSSSNNFKTTTSITLSNITVNDVKKPINIGYKITFFNLQLFEINFNFLINLPRAELLNS